MTEQQRKRAAPLSAIISLGVVVFIGWFYFGGGLQQQAGRDLSNIEKQVASDAVKQYEIAKRSGTAMDACVHAGLVAAAYIQAKDEPSYQHWKETEKSDCRLAGVER